MYKCTPLIILITATWFQIAQADFLSEEIQLPEIGDPSGNLLSPAQEKRFGDAFLRFIQRSNNVVDDPELNEYIQQLGQKLVSFSDEPERSFHFFLIDNKNINAFAGPNGNIGVHTGLLLTTQSESELASVMAHEVAHVTQHHLFRQFDAAQKLSLPTTAALLAAIILGSQNRDLGAAALAGVSASSAQLQINFTRTNEKEADRVGIKTLAKSGYDPRSMPAFFEKLQQNNRYSAGKAIPEFLRTHPITTNRIADTRARAEQYSYKQHLEPLEYFLMRVKIQMAASGNAKESLIRYQKALEQKRYANKTATQYGYALALTQLKRYTDAREVLGKLLKDNPNQSHFWLALGHLEAAASRLHKATLVYRKAYELFADNGPVIYHYAFNLVATGQPAKARHILLNYVQFNTVTAQFYQLLGRASGLSGHTIEGHQFFGRYYFDIGATKSAIKQIEIALKEPDLDFYQAAQLESTLAAYKAVLKQEKEDQNQ